jgi:hypothetical protein
MEQVKVLRITRRILLTNWDFTVTAAWSAQLAGLEHVHISTWAACAFHTGAAQLINTATTPSRS